MKYDVTNRLSEATDIMHLPQAEAWGFVTITALRAEESKICSTNPVKKIESP